MVLPAQAFGKVEQGPTQATARLLNRLAVRSPPLRRWLGFMTGVQVVLLFMALGSFVFPWLSDFVTSQLFAVYAVVLAVAKAVWFLSPVAGPKQAAP